MAYPTYSKTTDYFPVGLAILSEQLTKNKLTHEVCDLGIESFEDLINKIKLFDPKYIAFSLMSLDIFENYKLIAEIKKLFPNKLIVVGGPHISFIKKEIFEECPNVDFAIEHEGEFTLVDLLIGKNPKEINGLIYRDNKKEVQYNPIKCMIENLDDIPFPKYEKFNLDNYGKTVSIISSRGCPFQCTFCGAHLSMGKKWRSRSAKHVYEEIKYWYDKGYTSFNFVDSNFFLKKERVLELCDLLEEHNLEVTLCSDGMRANDVTEDILSTMKKFDFQRVAVGIESANEHILKNVKKGETLTQIKNAMELYKKYKIKVIAFFIIGLPGDTMFYTLKSFLFALKYSNICSAYFFNLNPLYKTELYEWGEKCGYLNFSREEIYQNIGGQSKDILLATPNYPKWQRKIMYSLSKIVSKLVEKKHKKWLKR